jgi:hypothetical protein
LNLRERTPAMAAHESPNHQSNQREHRRPGSERYHKKNQSFGAAKEDFDRTGKRVTNTCREKRRELR